MNLDDAFWPALWALAMRSRTRPEILLAVWFAESGLDPAAINAIGCSGLNQTCPRPGGPGFPNDDAIAFRASPASAQLAWIAPQVMAAVRLHGGPFTSASRYYQANFLPASLRTAKRPKDVIAGRDGPYAQAYAANTHLDVTGDGVITLEDLARVLENQIAARGGALQQAVINTYALRPDNAPWRSCALALREPEPSGGGRALALGALFALVAVALHARAA